MQIFLAILAAWAVIECLPLIITFLWWFIKYGIAILFCLLFLFSSDFRANFTTFLREIMDVPIVQLIAFGVILVVYCYLLFPVIKLQVSVMKFQVRLAKKLGWKKYLYKIFRVRKNNVKDDLQEMFGIVLIDFVLIMLFIAFLVSIEKVL